MRYAEVKEQPRQVREPWEIPDGAVMLLAGQTGMRSGSGPSLWADDSMLVSVASFCQCLFSASKTHTR